MPGKKSERDEGGDPKRETEEILLPANRTSDESPLGDQEIARKLRFRNHVHAPGQLPIEERSGSPPDSDESYGQTTIPLSVRPRATTSKNARKRKNRNRKP